MVYHGYKDPAQALRQAFGALKMDFNRVSVYYVLKIMLKILIRYRFAEIRRLKGAGS